MRIWNLLRKPNSHFFLSSFFPSFPSSNLSCGLSIPMGCAVFSHFSYLWLFATLWTVASRLLCPWILQARILEWVAMPSSRGSSRPRNWTHISGVSCTANRFVPTEPPGKPLASYSDTYICTHTHTYTHTQIHVYTHICSSISHWFQTFSTRHINRLISSIFFLLNLAMSEIAVSMEIILFLRGSSPQHSEAVGTWTSRGQARLLCHCGWRVLLSLYKSICREQRNCNFPGKPSVFPQKGLLRKCSMWESQMPLLSFFQSKHLTSLCYLIVYFKYCFGLFSILAFGNRICFYFQFQFMCFGVGLTQLFNPRNAYVIQFSKLEVCGEMLSWR